MADSGGAINNIPVLLYQYVITVDSSLQYQYKEM